MKRIMILVLASILSISTLVACTGDKEDIEIEVNDEKNVEEVELKDVHAAIKKEFGEDYIPNMELGLVEIENLIGLTEEEIEEFIGEMPMISINVDTFIAIKAKSKKVDEVESALKEYRRVLVEESMQYPMNLAKVNSSKVVRHGEYLFFIMIGKLDEREEVSEEEALKFAQEEIKRAEDVIDSFFE